LNRRYKPPKIMEDWPNAMLAMPCPNCGEARQELGKWFEKP
jgi:hypothetical protein